MEQTIKMLICIHAGFSGIALIAGLISIISKKGKTVHKRAGLVFFYSMLISGIIAMMVAVSPKHESPFLFAIGVFSLYFVLTGYRALRFKRKNPELKIDKWIYRIMIVIGILMIFLPIILTSNISITLTVFALVGIILSIRDLMLFKNLGQLKREWVNLHLEKMLGGYISAIMACVVIVQFFPSIYG